MRIEVRLEPIELGILPVTYREALQALVYRSLPTELAAVVHDGQYWPGNRPMKLFVFSQLHGAIRYQPDEGYAITGPVWFRFASPAVALVQGLAEGILRAGAVRLANVHLAVREVATLADHPLGQSIIVRTLSPITVYRTEEHAGRKRTRYYNPLDPEFHELVIANLVRKAEVLRLGLASTEAQRAIGLTVPRPPAPGEEGEEPALQIRTLQVSPQGKRLERYKGTWIEGWMGTFRLDGPGALLWLALQAGLGAKNSQGFGYVDLDPRRPPRWPERPHRSQTTERPTAPNEAS